MRRGASSASIPPLITLSYGRLFEQWRQETGSPAENLTFDEIPKLTD